MTMRRVLGGLAIAAAMAVASGVALAGDGPRLTDAERARGEAMITKAVEYLRGKQDAATGGWSVPPQGPTYPAITGLVVSGMLMQPGVTGEDKHVAMGVKFMLDRQQEDGGIYDQVLPSYNTSICVTALSKIDTPRTKEAVKRAVEFLKSLQYGEGAVVRASLNENPRVVGKDDPFYGGWGYGRHGRPDLSNSGWAIEALHAAGVEPNDPAFQRALVFLQRTQMQEKAGGREINDMAYAKGSTQGGFIYATSVNRDKVGVGQSFAGETAESLSGGPGSIVLVRLGNEDEKRAKTMKKAEVEERIRGAATKPLALLKNECVVLLGAGGDGTDGSQFEIRLPIKSADEAADFVNELFKIELQTAYKTKDGAEHDSSAIRVSHSEPLDEITARGMFAQIASAPKNMGIVYAISTPAWRGESRLRAYGSMTYSGFKSYLYANLGKDDPRVAAAMGWIGKNYTLAENPGLGTDGMYYYYVVFARAMDAWGEPTVRVVKADGTPGEARWASDLITRLGALQNADGSFQSVDDRWLENDPVLITAYGLLALRHAVR